MKQNEQTINVTIVGFGHVGTALALQLLNSPYPMRLNIVDPNPQCEGAFLDLIHASPLYDRKKLYLNDKGLFQQADYIYYSAGVPNKKGHSRLSAAAENIQLSRQIFENQKFTSNPYIIVITNPVDVVSHMVTKCTGLAANRVVGTGTFLDSLRLAYYLAQLTNHQQEDFDTMVLGEHGDSQVPIYSMCKFQGTPILSLPEFTEELLKEAKQLTTNAAYKIRETQVGTSYGVSKCAVAIQNYLMDVEEHSLTLSMLTDDYYRSLLGLDRDIYIGLPVIIQNGSIALRHQVDLADEEITALKHSAEIIERHIYP